MKFIWRDAVVVIVKDKELINKDSLEARKDLRDHRFRKPSSNTTAPSSSFFPTTPLLKCEKVSHRKQLTVTNAPPNCRRMISQDTDDPSRLVIGLLVDVFASLSHLLGHLSQRSYSYGNRIRRSTLLRNDHHSVVCDVMLINYDKVCPTSDSRVKE